MVSSQLQSTVQKAERSVEEMDFLRKQAIDKDQRVQELLLERAAMEERHTREVDEITETGVNEISELESKIEQLEERLQEADKLHAGEVGELRSGYEATIDDLKTQIQEMQV